MQRFAMGLRLARLLTLLAVLLPGVEALAGGFHLNLFGTRRTSMLTNVGNPDDLAALYHNPAGLAAQPGLRLHVSAGTGFMDSDMKLKALPADRFPAVNAVDCGEPGKPDCAWPIGTDGYYEKDISPERYTNVIPFLGLSDDLSSIGGPKDLVVALAAYAPGAYGANLPSDAPSAYYITDALFVIAALTAGAGYKVNDFLSVGANVSYTYMRLGFSRKLSTVDVMTPRGQAPDVPAQYAQLLLGDIMFSYDGADNGLGWGLGALVTPRSWLSIGASYTGFTSARFNGDVHFKSLGSADVPGLSEKQLRKVAGDLDYKLPTALEVEMPVPPSFLVGFSLRPSSWLELGLDLRLYLYSIYKKQVLRPSYDAAAKGQEAMTEDSLSSTKNYGNSWAVALGGLVRPWGPDGPELMSGISFDKSPVPSRSFTIDNPSMDQLAWGLGIRGYVSESIRLGASYMLIKYLERDIKKSATWPPTNVRISNYFHIPSVEVELVF